MGFEPTRAEHIGLAVQRLNHSATSSEMVKGLTVPIFVHLLIFQPYILCINDSQSNPQKKTIQEDLIVAYKLLYGKVFTRKNVYGGTIYRCPKDA